MAYLLDANVFIRAKNDYYGFTFCQAFWDWLQVAHAAGDLYSIDPVRLELMEQEDELSRWVESSAPSLFVPIAPDIPPSLVRVSEWATGERYTPTAVDTFLSKADYYLVGQGLARRDTVVTHEIPSRSRNLVKIPDACIALGVRVINTFAMLREAKVSFVLDQHERIR